MRENRSIPNSTVLPKLAYPDVLIAAKWLCENLVALESRFADWLIVIIPPSDAYGVHLWRTRNNFDDIHVKCFVNPRRW